MTGGGRGRVGQVVVLVLAAALSCGGKGRAELRVASGLLGLEPANLDFGDVALSKEARRTVTLRNFGQVEMTVDKLDASFGGAGRDFEVVGLPLLLRSETAAQIEVRYHPRQTGTQSAQMALRTDSPSQDGFGLQLQGHAVLGLAQLSPGALDFGNVVVGENSTLAFTLLNNDGNATTEIAIAPLRGADSTFFNAAMLGTVPLAPQQALTVDVDFTPPALGVYGALVDVTPCPTCQPRTVTLVGTGVERLLIVTPVAMDFGSVLLGQSPSQPFSAVNLSRGKLTLRAVTQSGAPDLAVSFAGGAKTPLELAPGATLTGTVTFAPKTLGAQSAAISLVASDGAPARIAAQGKGIGPILSAEPTSLYVGATAVGTTRLGRITVKNIGLDPAGTAPLQVSRAWMRTTDSAAWALSTPATFTVGEPGSTSVVSVAFTPQGPGLSSATLVLESNDGLHPSVEVNMNGQGRVLAPCQAQLLPGGTVEFGRSPIFHPTTQGFEIVNVGQEDCILGEPALVSGAPAFRWPGAVAPSGRTLAKGARMSVRVELVADQARSYSGAVELYVSNPGAPTLHVDLHGVGDSGCFFLTPGSLDFGDSQSGCAAPGQQAFAVNQCSGPVSVTSISLSAGSFMVGSMPALPITIAPNARLAIPLLYTAASLGDDVASLAVTTSAGGGAWQIGLTGGSTTDQITHDAWDQSSPKVDLLMVIDNSGSMSQVQQALAQNLSHLWNRVALANADYHIAVTSSATYPYTAGWTQCPGGASGGEAGRFFPVDNSRPRILTPQTPDVQNVLYQNTKVGLCHWDERFLEPIIDALTPPLSNAAKAPGTPWPADGNLGFLRDDARLSLLVISDTDDDVKLTNPPPVQGLVDQIIAVKHGAKDLISFSGIVPLQSCPAIEEFGPRNREIATLLNGTLYDMCNLQNMGAMLESAVGDLMQPLSSFLLSSHPRDPASIQVAVGGVAATNWTYDATTNRVVFTPGSLPAPGSHITANYQSACGQ